MLAMVASWTYGLVAQSVRAWERNSLVVGLNPTQANFQELLQRISQWWIPYESGYRKLQKTSINKRGDWGRQTAEMKCDIDQTMKLE